MNIAKNILISHKILLERKGRTVLSLSGIIIGVCSVIIMVAIGKGTEAKVLSQITKMGTNVLVVSSGQVKIIAGRERQTKSVTTLELKDADAILSESSCIASCAPSQVKKLQVKYGNLSTKTTVVGTDPAIAAILNHSLAEGRFFDEAENKGLRRVAVLGPTVIENLFEQTNPIGEIIRIGKVPFEVIGVLAPKGLDINGADQDDQIFIPVKTALTRLFNLTYINVIYAQVTDGRSLEKAESEIREILRRQHRLKDGEADDFTIQNQTAILEMQRESSRTFTFLIGSIAAVSLLVGGVGILAVMLISIRERIKEIGLRRALGAKRRDILLQFLSESVMLSFIGGVLGVLLGIITAKAVALSVDWSLIIPLSAVYVSLLSTFIIGVFAGVYPAVKAALLDPIKALQYE
jgi:putative ABC transport system permease protein